MSSSSSSSKLSKPSIVFEVFPMDIVEDTVGTEVEVGTGVFADSSTV